MIELTAITRIMPMIGPAGIDRSAVRIRRITITVNPCTHGHRAWVAL